ncbi:hypothetical protein PENTCL1PPCAC_11356 [Pristionchus entomophagus]|uniref:ubiquitinyl hydrolase 1 n=1 Tax=Pristionchus entomophagus TaxID=358040 RepID=A0AAV5TC25_9BILA|nr:hypothetical protein PENTCL1PPCAC_11356 [Pristionchus entomophagus]
MDGWEAVDVSVDSEMIWACQSTALDHYEMYPTSSNIQENVFESSLGERKEATYVNDNERRPLGLERNNWNDGASNGRESGKLIDVGTPTSSSWDTEDDEDAPDFRLLLRRILDAKKLTLIVEDPPKYPPTATRKIIIEEEKDVMEKGEIVRGLDESIDDEKIISLMNKSKGLFIPVASVDRRGSYGVVSEVYLTKLSIDDVHVLRPISIENRFTLYHDFARFTFVRHLKEGDEVDFMEENSEEMRRGMISSRDPNDWGDFIYSVRVPQRSFSPPRDGRSEADRRDRYRFYDDYEGNEHEGLRMYHVSADRLYPPTRRVDVAMERGPREPMRSSSRDQLKPVRILDSPPGYTFVTEREIEENREGAYRNLSGELHRFAEESNTKFPNKQRTRTGSPGREKIIPIRVLDSPPIRVSESPPSGYVHVRGKGNRNEENRQGLYPEERPNLRPFGGTRQAVREVRQPPPTKPRTKFDLDPSSSSFVSCAPFPPSSSNQSMVREPSSGEGTTNGIKDYARYAQEEDWRMNQSHSRMNGTRREEDKGWKKEGSATETTRVEEYDGWRAGDRCQWVNDGTTNEATVKWIGRLRGHNSVYAGLEFDESVGQGTGVYQGRELFTTPPYHAGFVMISTITPLLISTSSNAPPSYQTQNQSRDRPKEKERLRERENGVRNEGPSNAFHKISYPVEDRVGNASPPRDVAISGQGAMIPPPRYKESEMDPSTSGVSSFSTASARHRALPPTPPLYDAVPSRPSPPSVPPRPAMLPQDFMIESFDVGSCVDVCYKGAVRSGVVRWKGDALNDEMERLEKSVVVELETSEAPPEGWRQSMETDILGVDHTLSTVLVPLHAVRRDRRFAKESSPLMGNGSSLNGYGGEGVRGQDFGSIDSGVETSKREPWGGTEELIGRMKGIQGNRNSCYLDSMLYTLFVQCSAFDEMLTRRRSEGDIREYDELVRILSTEIVWPLRRFHYVRADHVMKLRRELEKALPSIKGLTSEEKDPEEILSSLFRDVFKTKPFLKLINSKTGKVESTWLYHVVVDADEWQGNIASSQHLLERSLRKDSTKLAECPQVFIVQLPRYGVTKLFDKIVPLEKIDLTPFINNNVFPCAQCQKNAAELYCHECYLTKEALYGEVSYCVECFRSVHMREGLGDHADRPIAPPSRPSKKMTRYTFTLSGVLAIETSHYVSFVRSSHGRWLFFDSMADREGLQNGFNIPQVRECERVGSWLSLSGYQRLRSSPSSIPLDDPLVNRLLSDSYICIYTADQPTTTSSNSTTSLLSKLTKELKISRN